MIPWLLPLFVHHMNRQQVHLHTTLVRELMLYVDGLLSVPLNPYDKAKRSMSLARY